MSTPQGESTKGIHVPTIEEVVSKHTNFVRTVLRRFHVQLDEIDDVMQVVFLTASRKLAGFDPAQSSEPDRGIRGLLIEICTRYAAQHRRSRARRCRLLAEPNDAAVTAEPESPTPDPEMQMIAKEREVLLGQLLAAIPAERRTVIAAYDLQGAAMEEIASELGVPVNTCWSRRHLGFGNLRAAWRRRGHEVKKTWSRKRWNRS